MNLTHEKIAEDENSGDDYLLEIADIGKEAGVNSIKYKGQSGLVYIIKRKKVMKSASKIVLNRSSRHGGCLGLKASP